MSDSDSNSKEAERWWSFREQSVQYSKEYGVATVRALVLINGGAIVATLSLISSLKNDSIFVINSHLLKWSFGCFLVGLVAALLVGGLGYLNFQNNALVVPDPNELERKVLERQVVRQSRGINDTAYLAIVLTVVSVAGFALGSFLAVCSLGAR